MPPRESFYPGDWLIKAAKDLKRVGILLAADDFEGASFHLQQGIEKYLKAYLLSKGWRLRRIHDLVKLLNQAVHHAPHLEQFRPLCKEVSSYYVLDRYPFFGVSGPTYREIKHALDKAKALKYKIEAELAG